MILSTVFLDVKIAIKPGWISRSCRHAGTRYNARGLDDDGEVKEYRDYPLVH